MLEAHIHPVPHLSRSGFLSCVRADQSKWPGKPMFACLPGAPWCLLTVVDHSLAVSLVEKPGVTVKTVRERCETMYALLHPTIAMAGKDAMQMADECRSFCQEESPTVSAIHDSKIPLTLVHQSVKFTPGCTSPAKSLPGTLWIGDTSSVSLDETGSSGVTLVCGDGRNPIKITWMCLKGTHICMGVMLQWNPLDV